jgi:uncharacterized UPF0146 family protein
MSRPLIRGGADLARFVLARYSGKVVEVGIGSVPEVALLLVPHLEVLATDKTGRAFGDLFVVEDDIFSPNLELYLEASLLYSIRPPLEMQLAMGRLALDIGADVIVRPLNDEVTRIPGFSRTLVNEGEARFYLFTPSSQEAPNV